MKIKLLAIILVGFLTLISQQCHKSDKNFCMSLINQDKKEVKKIVENYLATINALEDSKMNFKKIKNWLESNSCIQGVDLSDEIIETYPPIVEFNIVTKKPKSYQLILSISFDTEYKFINLKRRN